MLVLALVPGVSVITVTARAISSGFSQAAITTLGIVTGDIIYIVIAIFGLSLAIDSSIIIIEIIQYAGGAFLIWLGIKQIMRNKNQVVSPELEKETWTASYLSGLAITLGDKKAFLFYLVFFPAFVDVGTLSILDAIFVVIMAGAAILIAKLYYAYMATRAKKMLTSTICRYINYVAGIVLILVGILLFFGKT